MPRSARHAPVAILARRVTPLLVVAAVVACGLSDVFATTDVGAVTFRWEGESMLRTGVDVPIRISVLIGGQPLTQPRLVVRVSDSTVMVTNAAGDSIHPLSNGQADILVELLSSLTSGVVADTAFEIRVAGGTLR